MAAITGTKADVFITSPPSVAFTNEAATDSGDRTTYFITSAVKRYFDNAVAPTVQTSPDGTTWTTQGATTYTIQYVGGKVTFTAQKAVGTQVRFSAGNYFPYSQLAQAHSWELNTGVDLKDVSVFGSSWKQALPTIKGATAKVSRFWLDTFFATNLGVPLVLVLFVDTTNGTGGRYEGYARLNTDSPKSSVSGVAEEELAFSFDGQVFYVAS